MIIDLTEKLATARRNATHWSLSDSQRVADALLASNPGGLLDGDWSAGKHWDDICLGDIKLASLYDDMPLVMAWPECTVSSLNSAEFCNVVLINVADSHEPNVYVAPERLAEFFPGCQKIKEELGPMPNSIADLLYETN